MAKYKFKNKTKVIKIYTYIYIKKKKRYLLVTGAGDILDGINALFSLMYVMLHAVDTYSWPIGNENLKDSNPTIVILEIILDIFFILHFLVNFYISDNRVNLYTFLKKKRLK